MLYRETIGIYWDNRKKREYILQKNVGFRATGLQTVGKPSYEQNGVLFMLLSNSHKTDDWTVV